MRHNLHMPGNMTRELTTLLLCLWLTTMVLVSTNTVLLADESASQPGGEPETVDAWLDRIDAKADTIKTVHAGVRYERVQGLLGDSQVRFGTLMYEKGPPPRFVVHFDKLVVDETLRFVSRAYIYDGCWLLERLDEKKQFTKRQVVRCDGPDPPARDPLALGEGPFALPITQEKQKILEKFRVELIAPGPKDPKDVRTVHLRLVPRDEQASEFNRIDIWHDREMLLPVRVRTFDDSENESQIDMLNVKLNPLLDPEVFDTTVPSGRGWRGQVVPLPPADDSAAASYPEEQ